MLSQLKQRLRQWRYRRLFGKNLVIAPSSALPKTAQITTNDGSIVIGDAFSAKGGLRLAAVRGGTIRIGKDVAFNRDAILVAHERIDIGDGCSFGPRVTVYDHDHTFDESGFHRDSFKTAPVVIERNVWVCAGAIILRGTHIGEGSVIGAGCVVKGEIPPHSLVTGERGLCIRPIPSKSTELSDQKG